MIKKAYIEITDVCNLSCSFCHGTKREKRFMSPDEFRVIAKKIKPLTEYVYLHVLGEPLVHPQLKEILTVCEELGLKVTLTTNGTLLSKQAQTLLECRALYKVCVSLHSFEANDSPVPLEDYVVKACSFCQKAARNGVLCVLRLWNEGGANQNNSVIRALLSDCFPGEYRENRKGITLAKNIFLELGQKFEWPDLQAPVLNPRFCMALRDQIAVLCNGTAVPCCLDAEGEMALGNLLTDSVDEILNTPLAKSLVNGFSQGKAQTELCKRCDFAKKRFG